MWRQLVCALRKLSTEVSTFLSLWTKAPSGKRLGSTASQAPPYGQPRPAASGVGKNPYKGIRREPPPGYPCGGRARRAVSA